MGVGRDVVGIGNALALGDGVGVGALMALGLGGEVRVGTVVCVGGLTVGDTRVQATKLIVTASRIMLAVFAIICTVPAWRQILSSDSSSLAISIRTTLPTPATV